MIKYNDMFYNFYKSKVFVYYIIFLKKNTHFKKIWHHDFEIKMIWKSRNEICFHYYVVNGSN